MSTRIFLGVKTAGAKGDDLTTFMSRSLNLPEPQRPLGLYWDYFTFFTRTRVYLSLPSGFGSNSNKDLASYLNEKTMEQEISKSYTRNVIPLALKKSTTRETDGTRC